MAEAALTKVCPLCAETIKAAAKVCPHCQTRQTRFAYLLGEFLGVIIALVVLGGLGFLLDWTFGNGEDDSVSLAFKIHRHDLSGRELAWTPDRSQQYRLTGYVTNAGSYAWRIHELAILVKDGQGQMVDVSRVTLGKEEKFVVLPGQEHALSVLFTTSVLDTNSKLALRVQQATDGRERYDPN